MANVFSKAILKLILIQMDFDISFSIFLSFPIFLTLILSNSLSFSHSISVTSLLSMDLYHLLSFTLTHNYKSYFHNFLTPTHTQLQKEIMHFIQSLVKATPHSNRHCNLKK